MKKQITILSGAGISAESGISTFRDSETPIFFESFLAPRPPPKKISLPKRFQRICRWWILGILGQSYF